MLCHFDKYIFILRKIDVIVEWDVIGSPMREREEEGQNIWKNLKKALRGKPAFKIVSWFLRESKMYEYLIYFFNKYLNGAHYFHLFFPMKHLDWIFTYFYHPKVILSLKKQALTVIRRSLTQNIPSATALPLEGFILTPKINLWRFL